MGEVGHLELAPGQIQCFGYNEVAVHPEEAKVILARGFVRIDGRVCRAYQVDTINGYPLLRVDWKEEPYDAHGSHWA